MSMTIRSKEPPIKNITATSPNIRQATIRMPVRLLAQIKSPRIIALRKHNADTPKQATESLNGDMNIMFSGAKAEGNCKLELSVLIATQFVVGLVPSYLPAIRP